MYIFEVIWKLLHKKPKKTGIEYNPLNQPQMEDYEQCQHEFLPVDSTGEMLACIKCGFIVKRRDMREVKNDSNFE